MDDAVEDRGGLKFHIAVSLSNRELARSPDHEFGRRDIGPRCVLVRGGLLDRSKNPRDIAEAGDTVLPHEDLLRSSEASCDSRLFHDRDRGQSMKPFKHVRSPVRTSPRFAEGQEVPYRGWGAQAAAPLDLEEADRIFLRDRWAATSQAPRESRWATWTRLSERRGHPPIPVNTQSLFAVGALPKAGGYRSAAQYVSVAKQKHKDAGYVGAQTWTKLEPKPFAASTVAWAQRTPS